MIIECVLLMIAACNVAKIRVDHALESVHDGHIHKIYVIGSEAWRKLHADGKISFSYQDGRVVLNAEFVLAKDTLKIERILRHENGHILCQCSNEAVADLRGGNY